MESRPWHLLLLSAETSQALEKATDQLVDYLSRYPDENLADIAYACQVELGDGSHRRMLTCRDSGDAVKALEGRDPARVLTSVVETGDYPVAFMFSGLGDH